MRKSLSFDLEAFACEKIGLTRPVKMNPSGRSTTDIAQIKRRLLKAIQELESIGCRGKPAEGGEGEGKTRGRSTQKSRGGSGTSPRERRLGKEPNSDPRISRIPRPTETTGGGNSRAHGVTDWTRTDFVTAQTEHSRPLRFGYPGRTKCTRMSTTIQ